MDKKILKIANEIYDMKDFAYTRLNSNQLIAASKAFNPLDIKTSKIPAYDVVRLMSTSNYLWWAAKILFNITLSPMQALVLEELWKRPFPMLIGSRGFSKTFLLALYVMLKLRLVPGSKIVVCGAAYRQSKFVFQEANKMWDAGDVYRSTCGRNDGPHTFQDKCSFFIGKSEAHFVPVGDGQTIRGLRAHTVIMDEFGSVNPEIYEVVISGFGAVAKNPIENMNLFFKRDYMIKEGTWTAEMEENFSSKGGNQSILSGTCTYDFEHFARYWKVYKSIIESRGDVKKLEGIMGDEEIHKLNWKDYSIIRIPYELIPAGIMDASTVARAKASMTSDSYNREYGAVFSKDSAGFIRSSLIRSCVASHKNSITINGKKIIYTAKIAGDKNLKYVFGVDPASEVDNMAITVLELHEDHTRIVNCWTINRKKHQQKVLAGIVKENDYFQYCVQKIRDLMSVFPCVGIYMDAQGGGRTLEQALATPIYLVCIF